MNPKWLIGCGLLQLAILYYQAPWTAGLGAGLGILLILALFALSRLRWDSHLDMILIMTGPGGLGMMLPMFFVDVPACHIQPTVTGFLLMTIGMLLVTLPLSWQSARCVREARNQGLGALTLGVDVIGMQIGMLLSYLSMSKWPIADVRIVWMHHGSMLICMNLGMLAAMVFLRWVNHSSPRVQITRSLR